MKKTGIMIMLLVTGMFFAGCGKKQQSAEQVLQDPMSMEALSALSTEQKAVPEVKNQNVAALTAQAVVSASAAEPKLDPLPPSGPFKPAATEIQTALKNAGFYTGKIDGDIGPGTKKAVEAFQQANNLKVDGKVGPKTWLALSQHLSASAAEAAVTPGIKDTVTLKSQKN